MNSYPLTLDPDRLFPTQPRARQIARDLFGSIHSEPIISPHGHTDPEWFANNQSFQNATDLLVQPDHYVLRMLYSQGIQLEQLGLSSKSLTTSVAPEDAWRIFASHYYLFRGTPSRLWLDHVFAEVFGIDVLLSETTADFYYETITSALQTDAFRPRSILDRFNVEFLATTEGALDPLAHHKSIIESGWGERVVTTFRPDDVVDPDRPDFVENVRALGELTGEDIATWTGYLNALRLRRSYFKDHGATATDHGHPTARTANLSTTEAASLYSRCLSGEGSQQEHEQFRAQMLTEMARMSLDDGLVMQIHPGSYRNHNPYLFGAFGPDKGADIPQTVTYVDALKPLLDLFGNSRDLSLIIFTLDESTYARELAPLAGHYPCLRLGPPWWFHDSPEGMIRFRRNVTETAGFYNTAGFNDDTRALLSIPARHDLARRMDARFLAELVDEGRLMEHEAFELMKDLTVNLVREAYRLEPPKPLRAAVAE